MGIKSQPWNHHNSLHVNNNPSETSNIDELLYALLDEPSVSLNDFDNAYRPMQMASINEVQTRQAFTSNLDRLLPTIQQVLRRNRQAIVAVQEVGRMFINYFTYIGHFIKLQFNNWISNN